MEHARIKRCHSDLTSRTCMPPTTHLGMFVVEVAPLKAQLLAHMEALEEALCSSIAINAV